MSQSARALLNEEVVTEDGDPFNAHSTSMPHELCLATERA